jgi:ankyrin repeat protein
LLQHGAHVNAATLGGRTALHVAVEVSDLPLVTFLLDNGADIDATLVGSGYTALILALMKRDAGMMQLLCQYGPNTNVMFASAPLLHATLTRFESPHTVIRLLLDCGCDPRTTTGVHGNAAVEALLISHNIKLAKDLFMAMGCCLDAKAGLTALYDVTRWPLYRGREKEKVTCIQLLLAAGVDCQSEF